MATALTREAHRLLEEARQRAPATTGQAATMLQRLKTEPSLPLRVLNLIPDPWQARYARSSSDRGLLLTCRQAGKSVVAAAVGLRTALLQPRSLILLLSPSERQSGELMAKVFDAYDALGRPVAARKRTELQLYLANRSRIIALPENERTIRGYSGATLLIVDEAARVSDSLYRAVRPMLSVSRGRLLALSTPCGQRGWFYEEWASSRRWERVQVAARECPRHRPDFLDEERAALGERWYRQEYECSFEDILGAVFSGEAIDRAFSADVLPLFSGA